MGFVINHANVNVRDLGKSLTFYQEALGLTVDRLHESKDGSFTLAFLTDGATGFRLELTWLKAHQDADYDLGENESHLGFIADDYAAAHEKHEKMGVICFENPGMGIYFIEDPDGYWLEIVPKRG